jgi:predicted NUDIX family NTP pyrophosphohydrolase
LICKAAIHAGIIGDNGGKVVIGSEMGRKNYEEKDRNGVKSEKFEKEWPRSFSVRKYIPHCPIDDFKTTPS